MELCMHEKAVFFLPVNVLVVWSPAFLAARHTTVCLDISMATFCWFPAYDELFPSCQPKSKKTVTTATNYIQVHIIHLSTHPIL